MFLGDIIKGEVSGRRNNFWRWFLINILVFKFKLSKIFSNINYNSNNKIYGENEYRYENVYDKKKNEDVFV